MKQFTKICLIICGVFIILGLGGITVGMAMGARPNQFLNLAHYNSSGLHRENNWDYSGDEWDEFEEDWDETWNEFGNDMDDMLSDIDEEMDGWKQDHESGHDSYYGREETSDWAVDSFEGYYGSASTAKLRLDMNTCMVKIYNHEEDTIFIKGTNAKGYFNCLEDGETLTLKDHRNGSRKPLKLEIYLPKRVFEEIDIDLGATRFYAESLNAKELTIDLGAGEITVEEARGSEKTNFDVGTGSLNVNKLSGGDLELSCGVGSMELLIDAPEEDYNYKLNCGIGNIELNGEVHSGIGYERKINNHAGHDINMDCGIGNITLNFTNSEED